MALSSPPTSTSNRTPAFARVDRNPEFTFSELGAAVNATARPPPSFSPSGAGKTFCHAALDAKTTRSQTDPTAGGKRFKLALLTKPVGPGSVVLISLAHVRRAATWNNDLPLLSASLA
jgi:hypothetical protein